MSEEADLRIICGYSETGNRYSVEPISARGKAWIREQIDECEFADGASLAADQYYRLLGKAKEDGMRGVLTDAEWTLSLRLP